MASSTTTYPYNTVVYITDTIGGIGYQGSGVLIAPDEVLTASHMLFSSDSGAATNVFVQPGYDSGSAPYGWSFASSIHYISIDDSGHLITTQQSQYDYAVIHLSQPFSGLGYMSLQAGFSGGLVNVTGYPAYLDGQQQTSTQSVTVNPYYSIYDGTSIGAGSSGGPVWIAGADGVPHVVGLVSSGVAGPGSTGYFTQITTAALNQIETWVTQDDDPGAPTVDNLTIVGAVAGQAVSDAATITPFNHATIADSDPDWTISIAITLSDQSNGILAGGGSYNAATGTYTANGTVDAMNTLLDALVFIPASKQAAPGQGITTSFTLQVRDSAGATASDSTTSVIAAPLARNSIVFQNDDGSAAIWQMDYTTISSGGPLSFNPGTSWLAKASGDFNGDGHSDILWQNSDGSVALWDMNDTAIIGGGVVAMNPGVSWHVIGTADFNADGHSDILWQNDNGALAIWDMNDTAIIGGGVVANNPGASWHAVGTGDFYGNGGADILWQDTSGSLVIWQMSGTSVIGGGMINFDPGPSWHVKGIADMNGDGKSDIIFQNDDGAVAVWNMSGTTIAGGGIIGINPGPSWHLRGTGDFGNDGKTEILWQNDNGQLAIWGLAGTSIVSGGIIGLEPGQNWHALGIDGMRFINGTTGTGDLAATPGPNEFVFTSSAAGTHTLTGFNPTQDTIELSKALYPDFAHVYAACNSGMSSSANSSADNSTHLALGGGSMLLISGIPSTSLHSNNFVFV